MSAARSRQNTASRPLVAAVPNYGGVPPGPRARRLSRRGLFRLTAVVAFVFLLYLIFFTGSSKTPSELPVQRPVKGQYVRRIVAVGDLHGDYDNALKVLHMADVVDANGSWTGNVDYLVQTGDIIDRGDDTVKLYSWMERLREQAHETGGEVFSHLGNHEYMNALGDWRYVYQSEIATFGSVAERQTALTTGPVGSAWAHNYSVVSRVPLHPTAGAPFADYNPASTTEFTHAALSFMHGGLSPAFLPHATPYPSAINKIGATLLRRCQMRKPQPAPHPPAPYGGLPPGSTPVEEAFYGAEGPLWYRGWAMDDEHMVCSRVDTVLQRIGVRRLIMGHTPNFKQIVSRCGGKVIIIDTGISRAYGGVLSALSVTYTLTPDAAASPDASSTAADKRTSLEIPSSEELEIQAKEKRTQRWIEREDVVAIYPNRQVRLVADEREVSSNL